MPGGPPQRGMPSFEELQHGRWHLRVGQSVRLGFLLICQPSDIGHIQVDDLLACIAPTRVNGPTGVLT